LASLVRQFVTCGRLLLVRDFEFACRVLDTHRELLSGKYR